MKYKMMENEYELTDILDVDLKHPPAEMLILQKNWWVRPSRLLGTVERH
jgi:hypothetical protein